MNKYRMRERMAELADELEKAEAAHSAGQIGKKAYAATIDSIHTESSELRGQLKAFEQAARWSGGTEINASVSDMPVEDFGRIVPSSPMDLTQSQLRGLMDAARSRTPFSVEVMPKRFTGAVRTKAAVTESGLGGSFSGNLPPVQSLYAVGIGYESTRISDVLPSAAMPGPSATWLSHTANANEANIAPEGGTKVDLGPTINENQVKPTKIAASVTTTLEAFQDTDAYGEASFASWLPTELTRSLINEESNIILNAVSGTNNATFSGILQTSGTLTRSVGTDTSLDALAKSFADVRTGAAFADPDLVLIHPTTLGALRRTKDSDGRYLLDLLSGPLSLTAYGQPSTFGPAAEPNSYSVVPQGTPAFAGNLWGAQIAATTQVAAGTAVVMSVKAGAGIFWQRLGLLIMFNPWSLMTSNEMIWVTEQRCAFSCPRPSAINILTGLPTS